MIGDEMASYPQVAMHLGVHKTATTYVQSKLWNSLESLKENNVNYIGLQELRSCLTSKLGNASFGKQEVFEALRPYFDCERLIVSDENIVGGTDAPRQQLFYPNSMQRLRKVFGGLRECNVEVFVTVRGFADYLISRYTECLRHFKFQTFEDYISGISIKNMSWLPLLEGLASLGGHKIYINDFKYVVNSDAYIHRLIGSPVDVAEASDGSWVRRSKITNEAYNILKLYGETYSDQSTRRLIGMMDNHPQHTEATPFMPFTKNQLNELNAKYESELRVIQGDPRFNFISN